MQVYKSFFKVLRHYKLSLIMYVSITLVMLMALVLSKNTEPNQITMDKYPIVVVDKDNSEISQALYSYLDNAHNIKKDELTDDQLKDLMYYWRIAEYIEIPEGFGDSFNRLVENKDEIEVTTLLKCIYDESLPRGIFINMQMNDFLNGMRGYMSSGFSVEEAAERTSVSLDSSQFVTMKEREIQPAIRSYTAFIFLPFGILSIIFSQLLPVIISFNDKEKRDRSAISATSLAKRNVFLIMGAATVALIVVTLFIAFATSADGTRFLFTKMWWLAVLNVAVYAISVTMLLSMISSLPIGINKKGAPNTSAFLTNIIGLSFSFLGGTFVELDIMGDKVAKIGQFIPNYWYSIASRRIWYEGAGLSDVIECYGLQLLFGITCLAIGLAFTRFFKERARG